jgi:starch synthase
VKILFASSEVFPFSKTGGLADMAAFLPKSLSSLGHDVQVITPYYPTIKDQLERIGTRAIRFGGIETIVHYYHLIKNDVTYVFVQNMHYFERDMLYGYNDDAERFSCFAYAILEYLDVASLSIDILHLNDWQTGMVPYLLDAHYRQRSDLYRFLPTVLTIHNLEYQGSFEPYVSRFFNTDFDFTYVHFGRVNFLKAGIERATRINTVSPSYRSEVLSHEYGFSLDGALKKRESDFYGILNGIDYAVFDPRTDALIERNYGIKDVYSGKRANKARLLKDVHLDVDLDVPLIAYIGRLAGQKGINLMSQTLEDVIVHSRARFVLMGSGNDSYEAFFRYLTNKYPNKVAHYIGFNEQMAHQIYAAADLFLMPSRFEPCGLGQMIAMRYGTLPIVRETGGLKDTVIPYNVYAQEGTGFGFSRYDPYDFKEKVYDAIRVYENALPDFKNMVKRAMKQDFTLKRMAMEYERLYQTIVGA